MTTGTVPRRRGMAPWQIPQRRGMAGERSELPLGAAAGAWCLAR